MVHAVDDKTLFRCRRGGNELNDRLYLPPVDISQVHRDVDSLPHILLCPDDITLCGLGDDFHILALIRGEAV